MQFNILRDINVNQCFLEIIHIKTIPNTNKYPLKQTMAENLAKHFTIIDKKKSYNCACDLKKKQVILGKMAKIGGIQGEVWTPNTV